MSGAWPLPARIGALLAAVVLTLATPLAHANVLEPKQVLMLTTPDATPPASDRAWQRVTLPDIWRDSRPAVPPAVSWYRVDFDYPDSAPSGGSWALYLPYLYDGGQVWLNGAPVAHLTENSDLAHVRWARPHLVPLPDSLLRPGANRLMVRAALARAGASINLPRLGIGPLAELRPWYERRFFWVSITPYITAAMCLLVSAFVLFIWWRRRSEVLYGLFGLAAGLWGIRTLTFVIEVVPVEWWLLWRATYLGATGGFIVAMTVLALRYADIRKPRVERALAAYWVIGPLWLLVGGAAAEPLVNRHWIAGFLPIGMSIVAVSLRTMWRQRTLMSAVLPTAMVIGALAGLHDYAVNWNVGGIDWLLPGWAGHRIFLLHHGANLVLVAMGGLLTARFIQTLDSLEELNRTLETRVADRERQLAENYQRMGVLQRQHAASQERQLIMREIHDGLGSQLFVSLSRVERGDMQGGQIAAALRDCIADMRIALDTLTPGDDDFRSTLGNFMFRWQHQLAAAGVTPAWTIDVPDQSLSLSPHAALALLRIAQEALTNVLKHSRARKVEVRFRQTDDALELEVEDDGCGGAGTAAAGRGLVNMRSRAQQLGGKLDVRMGQAGTCVALQVPMNTVIA
jgi:signal transduction histidine kinase